MKDTAPTRKSIAVYVVDPPPHSTDDTGPLFPWLADRRAMRETLENLLGPHDPDSVRLIVDTQPAGPGWRALIRQLTEERLDAVVTHLAALTSAQRQQLIGTCAICGVQLVTPGSAIGAPQPSPRLSVPADISDA